MACYAIPKPNCQSSQHKIVDVLKDVHNLELLLVEKSSEVSNYLNESVAKREQTQEHLQVKKEVINTMMTQNRSCIQKLRSKIAEGTDMSKYLTPTDTPVSFCSIFEDLEKTVKEAKEEAEEADKLLNQVTAIRDFSVGLINFTCSTI